MDYAFDSELVPIVAALPRLDLSDIAAVRTTLLDMRSALPPQPLPDSVTLERRTIPGREGAPDVGICLVTPGTAPNPGRRPAMLWMHGGGFVMGDIDSDLTTVARIAAEADAVLVSVEYRLAPEHPYPAALDDCRAALQWLSDHTDELGIDPERIGVGGISAGAGLAAALTLVTRDQDGPALCFQFLETPVVDDRCDTDSMRRFTDTPLWTFGNAVRAWDAYLGPLRSADVPGSAAPARADDLSGLPRAYVVTCEFDPLRDEGVAYAQRLMTDGVATELHHYPGTYHGCPGAGGGSAVAARMVEDRHAAILRGLSGRPMADR